MSCICNGRKDLLTSQPCITGFERNAEESIIPKSITGDRGCEAGAQHLYRLVIPLNFYFEQDTNFGYHVGYGNNEVPQAPIHLAL